VFGEAHPDVASSLQNYASCLRVMGRAVEAEALYKRALAVLEGTVGRVHPSTAECLYSLGGLLHVGARAICTRYMCMYIYAAVIYKRTQTPLEILYFWPARMD
jgi:hypothetical protein